MNDWENIKYLFVLRSTIVTLKLVDVILRMALDQTFYKCLSKRAVVLMFLSDLDDIYSSCFLDELQCSGVKNAFN